MQQTLQPRRILSENIPNDDKRQYMRFNVAGNQNNVELQANNQIDSIIDISRGGMAVKHHKQLKVGDVVPVQISYGDLDINANIKVVTATDVRAGATFVNLDKATANKLLYMNILLEDAANTVYNLSFLNFLYKKWHLSNFVDKCHFLTYVTIYLNQ